MSVALAAQRGSLILALARPRGALPIPTIIFATNAMLLSIFVVTTTNVGIGAKPGAFLQRLRRLTLFVRSGVVIAVLSFRTVDTSDVEAMFALLDRSLILYVTPNNDTDFK